MNKKTIKDILIVIIVLVGLLILYFLLRSLTPKDEEEYDEYLKDYKVNEYIATYISDEAMARIYLNDYIYTMHNDPNKAYNLLAEEYRNKKFGNKQNYIDYINSLGNNTYTLSRYYKQAADEYIIFGVYDQYENIYIFKTKGVMQYELYLDDYTVEI